MPEVHHSAHRALETVVVPAIAYGRRQRQQPLGAEDRAPAARLLLAAGARDLLDQLGPQTGRLHCCWPARRALYTPPILLLHLDGRVDPLSLPRRVLFVDLRQCDACRCVQQRPSALRFAPDAQRSIIGGRLETRGEERVAETSALPAKHRWGGRAIDFPLVEHHAEGLPLPESGEHRLRRPGAALQRRGGDRRDGGRAPHAPLSRQLDPGAVDEPIALLLLLAIPVGVHATARLHRPPQRVDGLVGRDNHELADAHADRV
mmetsp:Transcript_48916/g.148882  ORF Transcript_48916/g.148882 Transcript_48916/m.148882 type:complete len:261 (-) Transcript_48916:476-1258(-)